MKVYLPHINYTVFIKTFEKSPKELSSAKAYTAKGADGKSCVMYLPKKVTPGTVVHEVVHVLRYICEDKNMSFLLEEEHMAYIAQYITNEALGYEYY